LAAHREACWQGSVDSLSLRTADILRKCDGLIRFMPRCERLNIGNGMYRRNQTPASGSLLQDFA
jgi:hypothetical protein